MKIIAAFVLCISLISCEELTTPTEGGASNRINLPSESYPLTDSVFRINNITHVNVGWVAVRLEDSSYVNINVPDSGMYSAHISTNSASCIIQGQLLDYGSAVWVRITEHIKVHVIWTTNVVVIDQSEVN